MNFQSLCKEHKIDMRGMIQVGSHLVKEYDILRELCSGEFIFVEANPNVIDKLKSKLDKKCRVFNNLVSDNDDVEYDFRILNHEQSSSMLEIDRHAIHHPDYSRVMQIIKLKSIKLDTLIKNNCLDMSKYNFLMMDAQGAEMSILKGFEDNIKHIEYIYSELNFENMYKGCSLEKEFSQYLYQRGFKLVKYFDTGFGWGDGLYIRS